MAELKTSRESERTLNIDDLPDELLLRIFSYIPFPELDRSAGKVSVKWSRMVKKKTLRRFHESQISYLSQQQHEESVKELMTTLEKEEEIKHIKITTVGDNIERNYSRGSQICFFQSCGKCYFCGYLDSQNHLDFCEKLFYEISPSMSNLQTLHLEVLFCDPIFYPILDSNKLWHLLKNTNLKKVTIVNLEKGDIFIGLTLHLRLVKGQRAIDVHCDGSGHFFEREWLEHIACYCDNECLLNYNTELEYSFCMRPFPLHYGFENSHFVRICSQIPNLEKLTICFSSVVKLWSFSKVNKLKKLKLLVLSMDYSFSRADLIRIFEKSDNYNLRVQVFEFFSKGKDETATLEDRNITVSFSKYKTGVAKT